MTTHTVARYRHMLLKARNTFMRYADNHRDKVGTKFAVGTPEANDTLAKASANEELAAEIRAILDAPQLEADHATMVLQLQKSGSVILQSLDPVKVATIHMGIGVAGEAGELLDAIKRWTIYGKDLDRENVVEELGDLEFFMAGIRQNLGITREETLAANMDKLGVRYRGHQYSDEQAIARRDKQPEPELPLSDDQLYELADQKYDAQMADLEPDAGASEGLV